MVDVSKAIAPDQIDEIRALITSLLLMMGVDIQGEVFDEVGEEFHDVSVALFEGAEFVQILANIANGEGSTEAHLEKLAAKLPILKAALARIGNLEDDAD